jgi:formylglycine-generating enzyme required for sulfatase activity
MIRGLYFGQVKETDAALPDQTQGRDIVQIRAGSFTMGSDGHYPEEAPAHRVRVDGSWIDRHPVTNAQYAEILRGDGYREDRRGLPHEHRDSPAARRLVLAFLMALTIHSLAS